MPADYLAGVKGKRETNRQDAHVSWAKDHQYLSRSDVTVILEQSPLH